MREEVSTLPPIAPSLRYACGWEFSASLPAEYRHVSLGVFVKFPLYIDSDTPQIYNYEHRQRYGEWSGGYEGKYQHSKWKKRKKH